MDRTKVKSLELFGTAYGKTILYCRLAELSQRSPARYESYQQRLEKEKKR